MLAVGRDSPQGKTVTCPGPLGPVAVTFKTTALAVAGMPAWPDPPPEEPPGDEMLYPDELPLTDPLWDDFRAAPFLVPPDAAKDWDLLPS